MEVPDKVGRALPVPENATSVRAWKFTYIQGGLDLSQKLFFKCMESYAKSEYPCSSLRLSVLMSDISRFTMSL